MEAMYRVVLAVLSFALLGRGCACEDSGKRPIGPPVPTTVCVDPDSDGYGQGCVLGADCNEQDAQQNFSCDCSVAAFRGCACQENDEQSCFESNSALLGKGRCAQGIRRCEVGLWGPCVGQILPEKERCDAVDNDCNGQVNEGLTCTTNCGSRCQETASGPGTDNEFEVTPETASGIQQDPDGSISLQQGATTVPLTFMWIANSSEGTVSKVNTQTGKEEGRYVSALTSADPRNRGHAPVTGNNPSRTAVDFNGDVWVANRAHSTSGLQGTVTKIANSDCVDVNGNGQIDTSKDVNGNGKIDKADPQEFLGDADECILFTVDVGNPGGIPRAVALDGGGPDIRQGNAWIGLYNDKKVVKLDAQTGAKMVELAVGISPYGAAIDSKGVLWATSLGEGKAQIVALNTVTQSVGPVITLGASCTGSYGIAVDQAGRVWVGGWGFDGACRYNPADGSTFVVPVPGAGNGRGIAVDGKGNVWVAHSNSAVPARFTRFRADDGSEVETFDFAPELAGLAANTTTKAITIGVGVDFDGNIWGVNQGWNGACRLNTTSGEKACFPVGSGPYTYSDFTGFALRNITSPSGTFRQVFAGCVVGQTRWKQVLWDAVVLDGTSLSIFVHAADSRDGLLAAPRHGPFIASPADLFTTAELTGAFLMVEVVMATEVDGLSPILKSLGTQFICEGET